MNLQDCGLTCNFAGIRTDLGGPHHLQGLTRFAQHCNRSGTRRLARSWDFPNMIAIRNSHQSAIQALAVKKNSSLDRVLGRLDTLDSVNLANLVQRLARERGVFEEIFNTLQEGILVVRDDGAIEYANASAQRLIGLGQAMIWRARRCGAWCPACAPRSARRSTIGRRRRRAGRGAGIRADVIPRPRMVRLYMVPFRAGGGAPARRFAVILSDITKEKQSHRGADRERAHVVHPAAGRRRRARAGQPAQLADDSPAADRAEAEEAEGVKRHRLAGRIRPGLPRRGHRGSMASSRIFSRPSGPARPIWPRRI